MLYLLKKESAMKTLKNNQVLDQSRRQLLKKVYVAPVVVALGTMALSSPAAAMSRRGGGGESYHSSGTEQGHSIVKIQSHGQKRGGSSLHQDNGWGNGDDRAPGRSGPHNQAENTEGGATHPIHGTGIPN